MAKPYRAKSKAILRQDKLSRIFVGAGALDSPLGGARFELSRAHVENIMWITQMRLQTKCRRGGDVGCMQRRNCAAPLQEINYNNISKPNAQSVHAR